MDSLRRNASAPEARPEPTPARALPQPSPHTGPHDDTDEASSVQAHARPRSGRAGRGSRSWRHRARSRHLHRHDLHSHDLLSGGPCRCTGHRSDIVRCGCWGIREGTVAGRRAACRSVCRGACCAVHLPARRLRARRPSCRGPSRARCPQYRLYRPTRHHGHTRPLLVGHDRRRRATASRR